MIYNNLSLQNLPNEKWKDIIDFPTYQVSDMGRVKSLPKPLKRGSFGGYTLSKERIKSQRFNNGYLLLDLYYDNNSKTITVHRLVAKAFISNPNNLPEVNHKKGIKTDNRATQLEWGTHAYNMGHGFNTGLIDCNGEKCITSKLKEEQVREIRNKYTETVGKWFKRKVSYQYIASNYRVDKVTIKHILDRHTWKHI